MIIKSGPSPRPLAWSLEVSPTDTGDDWRMVRAFGDRDHCRKLWDLRPERRRRKARGVKRTSRAEQPTCSTQFTSPKPLENGEVGNDTRSFAFNTIMLYPAYVIVGRQKT